MEKLLPLTWYIESPIDFEHKSYVLYSYLQEVDNDFFNKKILSPHLLHLEKLIDELLNFDASFNIIKKNFDKNRYVFFENVKLEGVEPRIKLGYRILKTNNQILF